MMFYQELTLISHHEISLYFILTKVFSQCHLALVEIKDSDNKVSVGISFPEYRYEEKKGGYIGNKLRLFAQHKAVLEKLDISKWLSRLADYVHWTNIREVPLNKVVNYAQFRRLHIKGSAEKLARRYAKRHGISFDEALTYYQCNDHANNLPYIQLKSLTNQQDFRLYIEKHKHSELIQDGFSTYGLSHISSVPDF